MKKQQKGQTLVIFAIAALALVFFIGLAVDAGSLYVTYGQLKRVVDSAAVAAANEYKKPDNSVLLPPPPSYESQRLALIKARMVNSAVEILKLQDIDPNNVQLDIELCDQDGDSIRDADLMTNSPDFFNRCPVTGWPDPQWGSDPQHPVRQQKKLVRVEATLDAPLYFLHLLGFSNIPLTTDAIAEAASVDMVLVFDTSESMGKDTTGYVNDDFTPTACNTANNPDDRCHPLQDAKDAAKALIGNLYSGYDRVGIVTFDVQGDIRYNLSSDLQGAIDAIDNTDPSSGPWVPLHDAAPQALLFNDWKNHMEVVNPVDPEDRDGNGSDADEPHPASEDSNGDTCNPNNIRWDDTRGIPCDLKNKHDVFDMDRDGEYTQADDDCWSEPSCRPPTQAVVDTCTGCGIRIASNLFRNGGRSGSVWVMVFLSDGVPNLSDRPSTIGNHSLDDYPDGFCRVNFWSTACLDLDWGPRYCIDDTEDTCPPHPPYDGDHPASIWGDTLWDGTNPASNTNYSTLDYARDMVDTAALTKSLNLEEPGGNEISIYTIGLGAAGGGDQVNHIPPSNVYIGEQLLRYMAAVGDDGDRETDPCQGFGPWQTCGQYYYAPSGDALTGIFLDIATRIYTRISE